MLRIVVVSCQPLCREALERVAREDLNADCVETFGDVSAVTGAPADLMLLDLPPSVDPARWLALAPPARRRVLVTPELDPDLARLAHAAGLQGLTPKSSDRPLMAAVLKLVLAGGTYFPWVGGHGDVEGGDAAANAQLSQRQRQVLGLLSKGRTNKEIAQALGISLATVKLHVQAILAAAGARNRTEAVSRLT